MSKAIFGEVNVPVCRASFVDTRQTPPDSPPIDSASYPRILTIRTPKASIRFDSLLGASPDMSPADAIHTLPLGRPETDE